MTRDELPFDPDVEADRRGAQPVDRFSPRVVAAVALGGALGAPARYGVAQVMRSPAGHFPWATLCTNVSGSIVLGVVLVCVTERFPPSRYVRPFVATGFLGAYTTFSTFAVEGDLLVRDGRAGIAVLYWVVSVAAGVVGAAVGIASTRAWIGDRR